MPIDLVLFDLDETLLSTEILHEARHSNNQIDLATVLGFDDLHLHDGIEKCLCEITAAMVGVGLVTSSPRWYVDQLLERHLPDFDFLVAVTYEDVSNIKPDAEPLLRALEIAGVDPSHSFYVGDDITDYQACGAAGIKFVGAGWANRPTFPATAFSIDTPQALLGTLEAHQ